MTPIEAMTPEQLVATLHQAQTFVALLAGTVLGLGGWIWLEGKLKENGCSECSHCQRERRERERRQRERTDEYARSVGLTPPDRDKDAAADAQRERLFGRQVLDEKPPEEDEK
jgi:hypothetical protein